jgi:hypothetical protein
MGDSRVKRLLHDNRGLRLHIWVALFYAIRPLSARDIANDVGCSADRVEDLLDPMAQDGYTASIGSGRHPLWTLTDKARQLPLPSLAALGNGVATAIDAPGATAIAHEGALAATVIGESFPNADESEGQKLPLEGQNFPLTSVVVVDPDQGSNPFRSQQQQTAPLRGKNSPSELLDALRDAGIFGKKRDQLLKDAWVTADRIQRAVRQAKAEGCWDNPTGIAITRLEGHAEPMTDYEIDRLENPELEPSVGQQWAALLKRRNGEA